jgi:predicted metal-dependent peptidase
MDMMERARYAIMCENVFWTVILSDMPLVATRSVKTAGTDGKKVYYNPEYVKTLTLRQAMGLNVHEGYHPMMGHLTRRGNRNLKEWNIAADLAINKEILTDGWELPKGALIDAKYDGMITEAIYALRMSEREDREKNGAEPDDWLDEQFDQTEAGDLIEIPDMTPEETQQETDRWKEKIAMAASMAEQAGQMTGAIDRFVKSVLYPPVSLAEVLEQFYAQVVPEGDEDWSRRDSRVEDYFEPTLSTERMGPVVVIGDTSGSVTEQDIQRCVGAIEVLMSTVQPEQIIVIWWDRSLQNIEVLETGDPIVLHPKGGGGTRMNDALDYVSDNYEPEAVIMITDCETPWPDRETDYPLIVLSTSSKTSPIGLTIPINDFA